LFFGTLDKFAQLFLELVCCRFRAPRFSHGGWSLLPNKGVMRAPASFDGTCFAGANKALMARRPALKSGDN
jgi:hypothetical protein